MQHYCMDFYFLHLTILNSFNILQLALLNGSLGFTLVICEWVFTFYIRQYRTIFFLHHIIAPCMASSNDPFHHDRRDASIRRPKIIIMIIILIFATNFCLKRAVMSLKQPYCEISYTTQQTVLCLPNITIQRGGKWALTTALSWQTVLVPIARWVHPSPQAGSFQYQYVSEWDR